jgi:hypothetical protein
MEMQGGQPPYIQLAYPAYDQQAAGLPDQLGHLSLQDPAFLQELQRLEQPQPLLQPAFQPVGLVPQGPVQHGPAPVPQAHPGYPAPGQPGPGLPGQQRSHEEVTELAPEEVRWFYRKEVDKSWIAFDGYDSLRVEIRYRHIWQTRWRAGSGLQTGRRAHSLNRYHDRSQAESYSGSSDEYNFSDPSHQYSRQQTLNSNPPRCDRNRDVKQDLIHALVGFWLGKHEQW